MIKSHESSDGSHRANAAIGNRDIARKKREIAHDHNNVGQARYLLIRLAAERIREAMENHYFLEATTLVESILAERLEKRAQYLHACSVEQPSSLEGVKDGFKTLGRLIDSLKRNNEPPELLTEIATWTRQRNDVIHEMAKLGAGAHGTWAERRDNSAQVAKRGIEILLEYDRYERAECHRNRKRRFSSATCPDALAPIGQPYCEWCRSVQ